MRTKHVLIIGCALLFARGTTAFADTGDAGLPGAFLSWGAGAHALGMGNAFTGVADDATALYWNAAGLTQVKSNQFTAFHAALYEDTNFDYVGYAHPLSRKLTLSAGWVRLYSSGYEYRDAANNGGQSFSTEESAFLLGVSAKLFKTVSLGAVAKTVSQEIFNYHASAAGLDLSALYHPYSWLNVGLNVQNAVQPVIQLNREQDIYPLRTSLGTGVFLLDNRLTIALDVDKAGQQQAKFAAGGEYWCCPFLAFRAGLNQTEATAGVGFKTDNFRIDYAFGSQALGPSHRFSFTVDFGLFSSKIKADPRYFSTLGDSEYKNTKLTIKSWAKYGIAKWLLTIKDAAGNIVRNFQGENNPPSEILWNGRDNSEMRVRDGVYRCSLSITDDDGRTYASPTEKVEIITEVPEPKIDIEINH